MNPGLTCKFSPWSYVLPGGRKRSGKQVSLQGIPTDTDRVRENRRVTHKHMPEHTGPFQGENPSWHLAQGRCREAGCSPGIPGARPARHRDAANAVELMMPRKAEAFPSSVVSATMHPQAMDQRGYEKIRRIHFNFKTGKFWHRR